jgi:hypothetical protein
MTTGTDSTDTSPAPSLAVPAARSAAPPSWPWRKAAVLLAGAAQLITIADLVGMDHPPVTWAPLLLAIAPVLLAAAAVFAPAPVNLLAAVIGVVVLVIGIAGQATYSVLVFVPALAALAVGAVKLWREQSTAEAGDAR